jgi:pimeloyl-ACP methyl ester carboxylesterase
MENIKVIDVSGIHTEVYARTPNKYSPLKIVIVPGNPGIVDFYVDFVDLLFDKFGQKHSVLIAGHAGQGAPGKNESKLFSLQEQIQHKYDWMQILHDNKEYELLSATCEGEKTTPSFIVMGHSIGGYITLKILKNTKGKFDVKQAVLLMPTFRNLYDGLAPLIKVAIRPGFRQTLSTIAHYAPTALMTRLARTVLDSDVSKPVINILQQKANYHVVLNCLYMAYCEAQEVIAVDDDCRSCFENDLDKVLFLYSQIDKYTPPHFVDDLKSDYPKANVLLAEKKVTHAFVVGYSKHVVEQISPQLKL